MKITIKGKHLDVGDSLRQHVEDSLANTAEKYFRDPIDATVIFTKEKNKRFRANVSIHAGRGVMLEAQHEADDPYVAFDTAAKTAAARLSRYKDKLRDHHRKQDPVEMHTAAYTTFEGESKKVEVAGPAIVAEMQTHVPTLAVSDAVMRLELGDLPALLFKNPATDGFNMVYRRKDGNIGWVDPLSEKKTAAKPAKPASKKAAANVAKAPARKKTGTGRK